MPGNARDMVSRLPWRQALQALPMVLLAQVRVMDSTAAAVAWLCAARGQTALWRYAALALGAALSGTEGRWVLPLVCAAAPGWQRSREGSVMLAGCICVTEAMLRCGGEIASAWRWLAGGLSAMLAALLLTAQEKPSPRRRAVTVGLAQNAVPLRFPGRRRQSAVKEPQERAPVSLRQYFAAHQAGQLLLAAGVTAGAARLLSGQAGMLLSALALLQWPEGQTSLPAAALTLAMGMAGVPLGNAGALLAMGLAMDRLKAAGRPVRLAGSMAFAGWWIFAGGCADGVTYLLALCPAQATVCLLPERMSAHQAARAEGAQRRRMQNQSAERLSALADALSDMAQASGPDPPSERKLLLSLRARLCEGCVRYERCWNGKAGEGLRLLCELITRSANGTLPKAVLPDMLRRCMRANVIPTRLYSELEKFGRIRQEYQSRMDGAQRAGMTVDTVVQLLRDMARVQSAGAEDGRAVEAALCGAGLRGVSAAALPDGWALSRRGGWTQREAARACRACGEGLGARYRCGSTAGRTLCIHEAPAPAARIGWAARPAEGSRSGDSLYAGMQDERRQIVLISDGMGVGEGAAAMSRRAVRLLRRLLGAGIPPERAALLANQQMMAQGSAEAFATLDLCAIDLVKMEAIFVKMAACDSYLLREHDCSVISGGRLPMGILPEAAPQVCVCRLLPGDVIVMGTDGAMENLDADAAQRCLIRMRQADESALCEVLLRAGEQRNPHADDRTLAVIRLPSAVRAEEAPLRYG